jgi:hypothetical protein
MAKILVDSRNKTASNKEAEKEYFLLYNKKGQIVENMSDAIQLSVCTAKNIFTFTKTHSLELKDV